MHLFIHLPFIGKAWIETNPAHPKASRFIDRWEEGGETFIALFRGRLRLIITLVSVLRACQLRSRTVATG